MDACQAHISLDNNLFDLFDCFFLTDNSLTKNFLNILNSLVVKLLPRVVLFTVFEEEIELFKRHSSFFSRKSCHLDHLTVGEIVHHIDVFVLLVGGEERFSGLKLNLKTTFDLFEHSFTFLTVRS